MTLVDSCRPQDTLRALSSVSAPDFGPHGRHSIVSVPPRKQTVLRGDGPFASYKVLLGNGSSVSGKGVLAAEAPRQK